MSYPKKYDYALKPGGMLNGTIHVPGDKSISHRAIMLSAIAEGETHVHGFLEGADALATLIAFRNMGVSIQHSEPGIVVIEGVGMGGLKSPTTTLDMGNSGTSMRLLSGLLSGAGVEAELIGDESLSRRPMARVIKPLQQMGAMIDAQTGGFSPLHIRPAKELQGINYPLPIPSAQIKSAVLLAGLYAKDETKVVECAVTRDHTERMLRGFGYQVDVEGNEVSLVGGGSLKAFDISVPGDISSAAFFMVGACIAPGSDILLEHVGINPTRDGVIRILRLMGANISLLNQREIGGEPIADIQVRYAPLHGVRIPAELVSLAIDEFPSLFIAAACAEGETLLTDATELRVKESDRIQVMANGLHLLGVQAEPTADGIRIQGVGEHKLLPNQYQQEAILTHHDHRIAMSFAIAALRSEASFLIEDVTNVATSFPRFAELASGMGLHIEERMS